ncbi:multidrug resistance protein fnx1 [Cordyceps javanica]|uniref:Multidrug resistance protein fnx1 n=1 Tax=Cordyceps javanica TaxID=43265 RepID=A0A545UVL8_9HYPO|nr:multidrug resistance protein fnx1 [Cordyceps javanica]TQW05153.1 multidrug resistance protein fnx1 [Cordyceps javanica]
MAASSPAAGSDASSPLLRSMAQHASHKARAEHEETTLVLQEMSSSNLFVIMCTAWLGIFLGAIDSTIIATLSGPISSEFNSLQMFSWIATAYLVGNAASQPLCGRLTDVLGRGPGLVASNILFAAGNLICGAARDQYAMVLGRVVAGIGGGGLICIATLLASDLIPLRQRGLFQGIANVWYGIGAMAGGVTGGFLHDHTAMGWRLAFFVQVPPSLFCALAAYVLVQVPPKQSQKSMLSRIDYPGALLTVTFVVLLLLGLSSGGSIVPWTHPLPLSVIPLSLVTFMLFIWWESKAEQPIIPVRLLSDPTVLASCSISFLSVMIMMTAMFYIPLFLQVRGESATKAGIKLLFSPASMPLGALAVGYAMKETGHLGGTIGLAVASSVYQNTLSDGLWEMFRGKPGAQEEIRRILDDLGYLERLPADWHDNAMTAFMGAFRITWLTMVIWALLTLICVFPMKNHKLHSTLSR